MALYTVTFNPCRARVIYGPVSGIYDGPEHREGRYNDGVMHLDIMPYTGPLPAPDVVHDRLPLLLSLSATAHLIATTSAPLATATNHDSPLDIIQRGAKRAHAAYRVIIRRGAMPTPAYCAAIAAQHGMPYAARAFGLDLLSRADLLRLQTLCPEFFEGES